VVVLVVVVVLVMVLVVVVVLVRVVLLGSTMPGNTHWHLWARTPGTDSSQGTMSSAVTTSHWYSALEALKHSWLKLWQYSLHERNTFPW